MTTPEPLPQPLIPLHSPEASLETLGGKGLNLIKLAQAGFPVPNAFLIPTKCYQEFVADNGLNPFIQDCLKGLDTASPTDLESAAEVIRAEFGRGTVSVGLASALGIGYPWLGAHPVAVRSSATAEDLPDMSFAGQQDTFLNVIGPEALLEAVVKCWSSLWTARAIGYRSRNEISHEDVALSVIVQNMVQADASGVLFTANPLTGQRDEIVIDATLGLGEALVGGHVEPDHYVVGALHSHVSALHRHYESPEVLGTPSATHAKERAMHLVSKFLGAKALTITGKAEGGVVSQERDASQRQAIPDEVIIQLAEMGQKIAEMYDFPQDIEWAYTLPPHPRPLSYEEREDGAGDLYILQSRPITSLFPLPTGLPIEPLRALVGFHAVQGVLEPITPLGQDTLKIVLINTGQLFGLHPNFEKQTGILSAAERLWINVTPIIRHPLGHKSYPAAIQAIDPGVAQAFRETILDDPRLAIKKQRLNPRTIWRVACFVVPFMGRVINVLRHPGRKRQEIMNLMNDKAAETQTRLTYSGDLWTDYAQRLALLHESENLFADMVIPRAVPRIVAGMVPFMGILRRFSTEIGQPLLYLEIARGLPHNVTIEMDLSLWKTAQALQADAESARAFAKSTHKELAAAYQAKTLPPSAQMAISKFMSRYGMRGLGEIDIGRPRWREQPEPIIQTLQNYMTITDPEKAPDVVFARGAEDAVQAAARLEAAVRQMKGGRIKARLIRWAVGRYRILGGMREAPKFFAIKMMSIFRQGLLESNRAFVEAGLLEQGDDLFFLHVCELDQIGAEKAIPPEFRERIRERRATRAREMRRVQLPRVLLSDGQAFFEGMRAPDGDESAIVGDPVSPGVAEGDVRVVLNPHETQLLPGEILVCPGTDPAWTPLFLAAGGLVMEVGGMMTHGSVVAREYGIPAVVGVHEATTRLKTGQRVQVDGSSGRVLIMEDGE